MAKLLLVDDDPVLLMLLTRLLNRIGHEVIAVENAAACLEKAAAEHFDMIITDVMMPGMDGYELTRRLRENPATREVRILILTSRLQGPDDDLAMAAGADAYDMKSVNLERLNTKIAGLLGAVQKKFPVSDPKDLGDP